MRLRRVLSDRRGTLIEAPILLMFVILALAIGIPERSVWKGLVGAIALMGSLAALVLALAVAYDSFSRLAGAEPVRRFVDSPAGLFARSAFGYGAAAIAWAAVGMFASIVFMERVASTPQGQLRFGRAMTLGGALVGLAVYRFIRQSGPRF